MELAQNFSLFLANSTLLSSTLSLFPPSIQTGHNFVICNLVSQFHWDFFFFFFFKVVLKNLSLAFVLDTP